MTEAQREALGHMDQHGALTISTKNQIALGYIASATAGALIGWASGYDSPLTNQLLVITDKGRAALGASR